MARTIYLIPEGTSNLQVLFPGLPWSQIAEYYLEVYTYGSSTLLATTPHLLIDGCDDDVRLHFKNYAGEFDALTFKLTDTEHETKSETYQKPTIYPLHKPWFSHSRFNVRSNDTHTATIHTAEENLPYLDELLDTPQALMEWPGTQGQDPDYIPVLILDRKSTKYKAEERFFYEVEISFKLSNERFIIRN